MDEYIYVSNERIFLISVLIYLQFLGMTVELKGGESSSFIREQHHRCAAGRTSQRQLWVTLLWSRQKRWRLASLMRRPNTWTTMACHSLWQVGGIVYLMCERIHYWSWYMWEIAADKGRETKRQEEEGDDENGCMYAGCIILHMSLLLCISPTPEQRYADRREYADVLECNCGIGPQRLQRTLA